MGIAIYLKKESVFGIRSCVIARGGIALNHLIVTLIKGKKLSSGTARSEGWTVKLILSPLFYGKRLTLE